MEGIYRSDDNGANWYHKGKLFQNRVYAVAIPYSSNTNIQKRMYVGTLYGLHTSSNSGDDFALVNLTKGKSIGAIAINPTNPNKVIAAGGWRDDYNFLDKKYNIPKNGVAEIFRFVNINNVWQWERKTFGNGADRNIFTIQYDKSTNNSNVVYAGSALGVYRSANNGASWDLVQAPSGTKRGRGCYLSPDGKVLYAAYVINASPDDG